MSAVRRIPLKQRVPGLLLSLIRFVIIFGLAFIILKPFVYKILMAFMSPDDLLDSTVRLVPRHFSRYYWKTALEGLNLGQTLRNTGLLSLLVGVIQVASCTMIGYGLARFKFRGSKLAMAMVIVIMLVPYHVISIAQYLGFVYFGVGSFTINLTDSFWPSLILAFTGLGIKEGLYIYLLREFFKSLPAELEEAAYIDGCTTLGVYSRVFLPLLTPVTATCAIRCGVGIWNDYLVCRSLLNENKNPTLMVGINGFFGARAMEFGYAFAGIILVSLPMIILFLCLQKYFIQGIAAGAVTG